MTMNSGELLGDVVLLGVAGYMINSMNKNNNNNNNQSNNAPRRKTYATRRKSTGTVRRTTRKTRTQRENRDWTLGSPFGQ